MTPEQEEMEVWQEANDAYAESPNPDQADQAAASVILAWAEKREAGLRDNNRRLVEIIKAYEVMFERAVGAFYILSGKCFPTIKLFRAFAEKAHEDAERDLDTVKKQLEKTRTLLADHRSAG
jgi:hypothetical protein